MMTAPEKSCSLAAIEPNQKVLIRKMLVSSLAELCAELGIREGDVVRCRASSARRLYLSTPDARTVAIERDRARFVRVVPLAPVADRLPEGRRFTLP